MSASQSVTIIKAGRLASGSSGIELVVGRTLPLPAALAEGLIASGQAVAAGSSGGTVAATPPVLLALVGGVMTEVALGSGVALSSDGRTLTATAMGGSSVLPGFHSYADLLAGTNGAPQADAEIAGTLVRCVNARAGDQPAGAGQGALLISSGGTWWALATVPVQT